MSNLDHTLYPEIINSELHSIYRRAAEEMLESLSTELNRKMESLQSDFVRLHANELIIPILFLYRHSLELHLKSAIKLLNDLEGREPIIIYGHNISELWSKLEKSIPNHFSEVQSVKLLSPMSQRLEILTEIIEAIDNLDPEGFTYRYPDSGYPRQVINIGWVKDSFAECEKSLEAIIGGLIAFIDHKDNVYGCT